MFITLFTKTALTILVLLIVATAIDLIVRAIGKSK